MSLAGQWIGKVEGAFSGLGLLELDDLGDRYSGSGFMFSMNHNIPSTEARIRVSKSDISRFRAETFALDGAGYRLDDHTMKQRYPDYIHGTEVDLAMEALDGVISFKFATNIGTIGQGLLHNQSMVSDIGIDPQSSVSNWADFHAFLSGIDVEKYIFRGQPGPFPLRTSFHRTSRSDLARYIDEDAQYLQRNLSPIISHPFDFRDPGQFGNFFNLVQHHGYPTPLLDWTESPYVAAYFAYRSNQQHKTGKVRVLMLEKEYWEPNPMVPVYLTRVPPHLSVMYLGGYLNPRMLPQHSVNTLTNVDDIERFIRIREKEIGRTMLYAFDLPFPERKSTLAQLKTMGITAGSLFPGLDGSCEALKMARFDDF